MPIHSPTPKSQWPPLPQTPSASCVKLLLNRALRLLRRALPAVIARLTWRPALEMILHGVWRKSDSSKCYINIIENQYRAHGLDDISTVLVPPVTIDSGKTTSRRPQTTQLNFSVAVSGCGASYFCVSRPPLKMQTRTSCNGQTHVAVQGCRHCRRLPPLYASWRMVALQTKPTSTSKSAALPQLKPSRNSARRLSGCSRNNICGLQMPQTLLGYSSKVRLEDSPVCWVHWIACIGIGRTVP